MANIVEWISIYTKKAWESLPVTCPTSEGLRIAHHGWTSNTEAHARMYDKP